MSSSTPLRVAVLINSPPSNSSFWNDIKTSYTEAFHTVSPSSEITFYDPVFAGKFPNPTDYDLIVLSGGKADASSDEFWVLQVLEFVRSTRERYPEKKILGICWGHQAIARALGGVVGPVPTGAIAAIQDIELTDAGKEFFPFLSKGSYRAPEFHVREVSTPAPGFIHLAKNNECFVNERNAILSFQAHPEISPDLARKLLLEEDKVYNGNSSQGELEEQVRRLDEPMDGMKLLERVIEWVGE